MDDDNIVYEITPKGMFMVMEMDEREDLGPHEKRIIERWYEDRCQQRDQLNLMNDVLTLFAGRFTEIAEMAEKTHEDPAIALYARETLDMVVAPTDE